jgi:hypothetical protein
MKLSLIRLLPFDRREIDLSDKDEKPSVAVGNVQQVDASDGPESDAPETIGASLGLNTEHKA